MFESAPSAPPALSPALVSSPFTRASQSDRIAAAYLHVYSLCPDATVRMSPFG